MISDVLQETKPRQEKHSAIQWLQRYYNLSKPWWEPKAAMTLEERRSLDAAFLAFSSSLETSR